MKHSTSIAAVLLALTAFGGAAALAETAPAQTAAAETGKGEDPKAEAKAFLASPTSPTQAIATAEKSAGGKVAGVEHQGGENGGPDLILADVVMTDGTEKTVAINPADGKVMSITPALDEQHDEEGGIEQGSESTTN